MGEILEEFDEDSAIYEEAGYISQEKKQYQLYDRTCTEIKPVIAQKRHLLRNRFQQNNGEPTADVPKKNFAKVRGIWGFAGDNESDGYFGGQLIKNRRVVIFRGVYNTTDNESYGKVVGIMKRGYFNGRLVTPDGEKCRITGLYKIDKENKTLKLRWMTPQKMGWAVAKIILPDQ
jgi:hypothetical protein